MAAKPEVLLTSPLQIEKSFKSWNGVTKLAAFTRHQPTAGDTSVCSTSKTFATTGSRNNLVIYPNIVIVRNEKKQVYSYA